MPKTRWFMIGIAGVLLTGCMDTNGQQEGQRNDDLAQPIQYRANDGANNQQTGTDQRNGDQVGMQNIGDGNPDGDRNSYEDENLRRHAEEIERTIAQHDGVQAAQTVITDDRIYVAIQQVRGANPAVVADVRLIVEEMTNRKDIVVYTDRIYFDRMKNLKTRQEPLDKFFGG
ncbi:YhcN/YlaJ family sporulation lipoprotein [Salirhabdus salicampi]|uniref:YhcN/YlaJ family sporulation lipoprotein n=1 Tax=Salirhabdus salicampi TaxID=476102 RepID=UPI0020C32DCA|nr:YhcN/YlaJ family sporulation lipoprotein [Salirhabdus salicampi]MCP8616995.1 YhcN/YlaJ family sporulation lipoprotein [Salirhabdus salicampi]